MPPVQPHAHSWNRSPSSTLIAISSKGHRLRVRYTIAMKGNINTSKRRRRMPSDALRCTNSVLSAVAPSSDLRAARTGPIRLRVSHKMGRKMARMKRSRARNPDCRKMIPISENPHMFPLRSLGRTGFNRYHVIMRGIKNGSIKVSTSAKRLKKKHSFLAANVQRK